LVSEVCRKLTNTHIVVNTTIVTETTQ